MSWRFLRRFRLGGGFNLNLTRSGLGWSWGVPGVRIGTSGAGRRWISFGIPGTGLYFYKTLGFGRRPKENSEPQNTEFKIPAREKNKLRKIKWKNKN
jgi:hypothetical protein